MPISRSRTVICLSLYIYLSIWICSTLPYVCYRSRKSTLTLVDVNIIIVSIHMNVYAQSCASVCVYMCMYTCIQMLGKSTLKMTACLKKNILQITFISAAITCVCCSCKMFPFILKCNPLNSLEQEQKGN